MNEWDENHDGGNMDHPSVSAQNGCETLVQENRAYAGYDHHDEDMCHTLFLCQNRVFIICMTQDQMFHTYGQKCSQITKSHSIEYIYYINNVFKN
jgi:hypothetical protein